MENYETKHYNPEPDTFGVKPKRSRRLSPQLPAPSNLLFLPRTNEEGQTKVKGSHSGVVTKKEGRHRQLKVKSPKKGVRGSGRIIQGVSLWSPSTGLGGGVSRLRSRFPERRLKNSVVGVSSTGRGTPDLGPTRLGIETLRLRRCGRRSKII